MKKELYKSQLARTRAADAYHKAMKQWYADKLGVEYSSVMNDIARLPKNQAEQLYQEWLNEGSA